MREVHATGSVGAGSRHRTVHSDTKQSTLASFFFEASALGAGAVHGSVCVVAALPPAPSLRTSTLPPSVSLFVFIGSLAWTSLAGF